MKTILKLVFLGAIVFLAWKYLNHNNIDVKERLSDVLVRAQNEWGDLRSTTEEKTISPQTESEKETFDSQEEENTEKTKNNTRPEITHYRTNQKTSLEEEGNEKEEAITREKNRVKLADIQSQQYETENFNIEWVKTVTRKYSPDSWQLLMLYDELPQNPEAPSVDGETISSHKSAETFHYLGGSGGIELLSSMSDNVHEIAHGYFNQNVYHYALEKGLMLDFDKVEGFIFVSPQKSFFISYPQNPLFPSKLLAAEIPSNLRTFRFDTYITGNTSTQDNGVIGLLNEFHAYYLGSKFDFEMLDAYKIAAGSDAPGFFAWVNNSQSSMSAFYEFDYFIREYLLYMKGSFPSAYLELISYRPFIDAYRSVYKSYDELISKYQLEIESEMDRLNKSGEAEATIKDKYLWLRYGQSNRRNGTQMFSDAKELLMPILVSDRYSGISSDLMDK